MFLLIIFFPLKQWMPLGRRGRSKEFRVRVGCAYVCGHMYGDWGGNISKYLWMKS